MTPVPFLTSEFNEDQARFSSDGRWVVYVSDESGQQQVYVRSITANGGKWLISNGFGAEPRWRDDDRELYYRSADGRLTTVEIATTPVFRAGIPKRMGVFTMPPNSNVGNITWDSTGDGKRFLLRPPKTGPQQYTVLMNWQTGLRQ